ncbi:MAG: HEAT repeat domain-containing protein [Bryobacterales bacterium]
MHSAFAAGCASPELDPVEQLYLRTATGPGAGDTQVQAVRELAERDDPRVEGMLIRVAQTALQPGRDRVRIEAVRQLRLRGSASAVPDLAALLSPDRTLELRQELALAYAQLGCPAVCIKATLRYLKRIWQGELNIEERRFESVRSHVRDPSLIPRLPRRS